MTIIDHHKGSFANARTSSTRRRAQRKSPRLNRFVEPALLAAVLITAFVAGWRNRDEGLVTPEHGVGYWLGILGAGAMLLLLVYPLRKRLRLLAVIGSIPFWFRTHMVLGLVGPLLILFHANFKLGSLNSNVALFSMLLVAGSGLVGRYLYGKIHRGLDGARARIDDIIAAADHIETLVGSDLPIADEITATLHAFRDEALRPVRGIVAGLFGRVALGVRGRRLRRTLLAEAKAIIRANARAHGWPRRATRERLSAVNTHLTLFFATVRTAASFALYERLFALWHVLHLPLFLLLILTATLHVIAVHIY